jgi:hypothetical protein
MNKVEKREETMEEKKKEQMEDMSSTVVVMGIDIGIRNLSFCVLAEEHKGQRLTTSSWKTVDLLASLPGAEGLSCNKVTPLDLHEITHYVFGEIFSDDFIRKNGVQHIVIEQQPHGKYANVKMIVLSHLLLDHFRRMVYRRAAESDFPLKTAGFVSAATKYPNWFLRKNGWKKQKKYDKRKRLGIVIAETLCRWHDLHWEMEHKKKDDYADSFLLAYFQLSLWNPRSITSSLLSVGTAASSLTPSVSFQYVPASHSCLGNHPLNTNPTTGGGS